MSLVRCLCVTRRKAQDKIAVMSNLISSELQGEHLGSELAGWLIGRKSDAKVVRSPNRNICDETRPQRSAACMRVRNIRLRLLTTQHSAPLITLRGCASCSMIDATDFYLLNGSRLEMELIARDRSGLT